MTTATATAKIDGDQLATWVREGIEEIIAFVYRDEFQAVVRELYSLPNEQRDAFVRQILLRPEELKARGVTPPEGMIVQRSHFADERPTIFCVTKYLPDGKRKVTVTYDAESDLLLKPGS